MLANVQNQTIYLPGVYSIPKMSQNRLGGRMRGWGGLIYTCESVHFTGWAFYPVLSTVGVAAHMVNSLKLHAAVALIRSQSTLVILFHLFYFKQYIVFRNSFLKI